MEMGPTWQRLGVCGGDGGMTGKGEVCVIDGGICGKDGVPCMIEIGSISNRGEVSFVGVRAV